MPGSVVSVVVVVVVVVDLDVVGGGGKEVLAAGTECAVRSGGCPAGPVARVAKISPDAADATSATSTTPKIARGTQRGPFSIPGSGSHRKPARRRRALLRRHSALTLGSVVP